MIKLAPDIAIFGGGAAGLWLLDGLQRHGYQAVLLEAGRLGAGQTIAAQGIIHGGLKYTLDGIFSPAADRIAEMPELWRACRAGEAAPDLRGMRLRSECCYLWRTADLTSRLGMLGARAGLRVRPTALPRERWPEALRGCAGEVFRLDEEVIEPASLLERLAAPHRDRLLRFDGRAGIEWSLAGSGEVREIRLLDPGDRGGAPLVLAPGAVVFAAGEGNALLREQVGLSPALMQRRPLHMVLLRGDLAELPELNGHCTDRARTRVTVTTTTDSAGRRVWQVGGQVAEDGTAMGEDELVAHARRELRTVLPGFDGGGAEWATYRVDRAEVSVQGGKRPNDAWCQREGNVITAWPTKLALAPRLAEQVRPLLDGPRAPRSHGELPGLGDLAAWPRPEVALPPWETERTWFRAR